MSRASVVVISELLAAMRETVTDYGELGRTNDTLATIIQGTAFYPGGSGLWHGDMPFDPLPEFFPEKPIMFVAHNFDKESSYRKSLLDRTRAMNDLFWVYIRAYIREAGLKEDQCFFTNALMGLQPVKATGTMNTTPLFREQCRMFMQRQIEIVKPCCVAILGADAAAELQSIEVTVPSERLHHPSWLKYQKMDERPAIISAQAAKIKQLWESS